VRVEELLFAHAKRQPEQVAVVCGAQRITYRELVSSLEITKRPGERIPLHLPNGIEFVRQAYSVFASRGVLVPINTRLAPPEAERLRRDCLQPSADTDENDALILYTSGTTGRPKGAVNTHANVIVQNVEQHAAAMQLDAADRFLATTPLAHRAGVARMFNALGLGGTLVVMERFDAGEALALIARERITVAGLPPTVLRLMLPGLRREPSGCASLRRIIVSAEAFPHALLEEISALLPRVRFFAVYGMSEAAISIASHEELFSHPGTAGRPWPGVEIRLEADELLVRGKDAVMKGYFNDPQANAEAFRGGWFHTGDLARRDAAGNLYIVDRKKDMIVSGGYNVYSKELEQVLLEHPAVEDAAVIGVPDDTYGEAVVAVIQTSAKLSSDAVVAHCRTQLADYKKPRHVFFVDALPRNPQGKVLKPELRIRIRALLGKPP